MTSVSARDWEIIHIPEKPRIPAQAQSTVNVYAAMVYPKHANTLVRKLNQIAPFENLRHVKRVHKENLEGGKTQLSVILCLASEHGCQLDGIPTVVLELINSYQLTSFITKVCKYAALSKEEWEEQCKLWPTSYHPPTYNIDGITGFSEDDSRLVLNFMKLAVDMVNSGDNQVVNAAVIVDPSNKQVIARARDEVHSRNPLINQTGVENGVFKQREAYTSHPIAGSVETHTTSLSSYLTGELEQFCSGVSCLYPWQWAEKLVHSNYRHPLRHAAIVALNILPPGTGIFSLVLDIQRVAPLKWSGSSLRQWDVQQKDRRQFLTMVWIVINWILISVVVLPSQPDLIYVQVMTSLLFGSLVQCVQWHSCITELGVYFMPSQTQMMGHWEAFADYKGKKA